MNSKLLILSLGLLSAAGCSTDENPFIGNGAGASSSNVITSDHFAITTTVLNPNVLELSFPLPDPDDSVTDCGNIAVIWAPITATITVTGADKDGALASGNEVFFNTQYGLLDQTSCTLASGTCSVEWSSIANSTQLWLGPDYCALNSDLISVKNTIVAWTYGAEGFLDADGDGQLSDSEIFLDTDEPYIDNNRGDGTAFVDGTDTIIDVTTNDGMHNDVNGTYDGPNCDTATHADCGSAALIPIYVTVPLRLSFTAAPPAPPAP